MILRVAVPSDRSETCGSELSTLVTAIVDETRGGNWTTPVPFGGSFSPNATSGPLSETAANRNVRASSELPLRRGEGKFGDPVHHQRGASELERHFDCWSIRAAAGSLPRIPRLSLNDIFTIRGHGIVTPILVAAFLKSAGPRPSWVQSGNLAANHRQDVPLSCRTRSRAFQGDNYTFSAFVRLNFVNLDRLIFAPRRAEVQSRESVKGAREKISRSRDRVTGHSVHF